MDDNAELKLTFGRHIIFRKRRLRIANTKNYSNSSSDVPSDQNRRWSSKDIFDQFINFSFLGNLQQKYSRNFEMNIQKIIPKVVKNLLSKNQSKKISELANKPKETQVSKEAREYSLLAEKKILTADEYRNLMKNTIRKSSGVADEYKLGHTVPGLRWMAGNQYRTTLVFTLFFLPPCWAPFGLFCIMWNKQMGWISFDNYKCFVAYQYKHDC